MRLVRYLIGLALLSCGLSATVVLAEQRLDLERQLYVLDQGETPPQAIGGAEYRIGVFTFEDPDRTGLGNALAELVAHDVLLNARSRSLGVLVFTGGLAPARPGGLSYFDKVERVAAAQAVDLVVWGAVRRAGPTLAIETFLQIPRDTLEREFTARVRIPAASDPGRDLLARLRPDRFAVQRLSLPAEGSNDFEVAVGLIRELRQEPREDSAVDAVLRTGELFYPVDRYRDWVQLQVHGGGAGWVPLRSHCDGACAPLLEATAFVRGVLGFVENRSLPETGETLTTEALAVREQLEALNTLRRRSPSERTLVLAQRWSGAQRLTGRDADTHIDRGRGIPPGGATFANIAALAQLKRAMDAARRAGQSPLLDKDRARDLAFELAEASQYDPRNPELLQNAQLLFDYAGDTQRAALAQQLSRNLRRR